MAAVWLIETDMECLGGGDGNAQPILSWLKYSPRVFIWHALTPFLMSPSPNVL
jgi:hypothetical protein